MPLPQAREWLPGFNQLLWASDCVWQRWAWPNKFRSLAEGGKDEGGGVLAQWDKTQAHNRLAKLLPRSLKVCEWWDEGIGVAIIANALSAVTE